MLLIPELDGRGKLPAGVYWVTWEEMVLAFGFTSRRERLLISLNEALRLLKAVGCKSVYIDGSFVTGKPEPGDFDACWAVQGVDAVKLDPVFLDFANSRTRQKNRFLGEFFPASCPKGLAERHFWNFSKLIKRQVLLRAFSLWTWKGGNLD